MTMEGKIMRTVRVHDERSQGVLAHLITAVSAEGGSIGEVRMLTESSRYVVRDIGIYADNDQQMENNPGCRGVQPGHARSGGAR